MRSVLRFTLVGMLSLFLTVASTAQAAIVSVSTNATNWDLPPTSEDLDDLTLTLGSLPTNAISNLSVTFRLRADLDLSTENVTMSIDGYSFGIWLNSVVGDDTITDNSVLDMGDQLGTLFVGTATIPNVNLLPLLADGSLSALFDFSINSDDLTTTEFAEFEIQYETGSNAAVPEPASMVLFSLGMCGLAWARRRQLV